MSFSADMLEEDGFLALPGLMGAELRNEVRVRIAELFTREGSKSGEEFKQEPGARRLANLVNKGEVFERVITHSVVLGMVAEVLGPDFKLSSLNVRSANPKSGAQPLHVDGGYLADDSGYRVCNTVWMLDDFTQENGATRVVPGSHRWRSHPSDAMVNPNGPHPQQRLVTGAAGTVVVMNAHIWHGGTANRTARPRLAMHAYYTRRDMPQQQYQKRLLSPEVQARLGPLARKLCALDDPLNDELCAQATNMSGFLK